MHNKLVRFSLLALVSSLAACVAAPAGEASGDEQGATEDLGEAQQAASNVTLAPGQYSTFPTWSWWGWTNVKVTNSTSTSGSVLLTVGGAVETLIVPANTTNQVSRQWAGLQLEVKNNSTVTLQVEVW